MNELFVTFKAFLVKAQTMFLCRRAQILLIGGLIFSLAGAIGLRDLIPDDATAALLGLWDSGQGVVVSVIVFFNAAQKFWYVVAIPLLGVLWSIRPPTGKKDTGA